MIRCQCKSQGVRVRVGFGVTVWRPLRPLRPQNVTGRTFISGVATTRDDDEGVMTEVESRQSPVPDAVAAATAVAHQSLDHQRR